MKELIGLTFKRNVYGLSEWTDTVTSVHIRMNCDLDCEYWKPKISILGTRTISYDLEEIVFVSNKTKNH